MRIPAEPCSIPTPIQTFQIAEDFSGFVNRSAAALVNALRIPSDLSAAGLLEGLRQPEHLGLAERRAENLQPDRQALPSLAGGH